MDLYFFNAWGNGDVHVSRGFVKDIVSKGGFDNYYYMHRHSSDLLLDIPQLTHVPATPENVPAEMVNYDSQTSRQVLLKRGEDTIINTWYETKLSYSKLYEGAFFKVLYDNFSVVYNKLGIEISEDPFDYFPNIDFSFYDTEKIKNWVENSPFKTRVLICNERCASTQTNSYDLSQTINNLANKLENVAIIVSNEEEYAFEPPRNVFFASDITESKANLNEISFLSTHCDLIFGRGSGVHSFTVTKQNCDRQTISNWKSSLGEYSIFSPYQNIFPLLSEDYKAAEYCVMYFASKALRSKNQ